MVSCNLFPIFDVYKHKQPPPGTTHNPMSNTLTTLAGPALLTFALCTIAFAVVITF